MEWIALATALFGAEHGITREGDMLHGTAFVDGEPLAVIGTTDHAPIGVRLALQQARAVLETIARHPGRYRARVLAARDRAVQRQNRPNAALQGQAQYRPLWLAGPPGGL